MKSIKLLLAAAFLFLALVHIAPAKEPAKGLPRVSPEKVGMDADVLGRISFRMKEFVNNGEVSGVVTLVAREGKIVHLDAVGQRDAASGTPIDPNTVFAIASMTKPITATAVMILLDEGKLALDDPVAKYIPEFKDVQFGGKSPRREITIRDCLTHTSGVVGSQQNVGSLAETAKALAKRPLGFQPGEKWQYSPGLTVCGRVVEVAAGMPYEKFLQQRIFDPLGMKDTTFFPDKAQQKRLATLYKPGKGKGTVEATSHWISDLSADRTPNPSGGLFSTAEDLSRFYQAILGGGELDGVRIVSAEGVKNMTTRQTGELQTGFTPGNGWGLGWCVVQKPQGVSAMLSPGTHGHGGAFGTQGWIDPQRKMIFVLLIQRTGFGNSDASDIRKTFQSLAVESLKN